MDLERKTNRQLVKLYNDEGKLAALESELSHNPQFVKFLEAQKSLQKKVGEFWDRVKEEMIENDIKEIHIDNDLVKGKLSISYVKSYETEDINKVNNKFTLKALDVKKVAEAVELTGEIPNGVNEKGYYRLNKTLKSKDVVS